MKILLLLSESWNDKAAPNNNMTNWFLNFPDVEIWTISGSSMIPDNKCCDHYYLISENDMLKSLFSGVKAGKEFHTECSKSHDIAEEKPQADISDNKRIKQVFSGEAARLARDIVWRYGRYDLESLSRFIRACDPDIVFSQRKGSVKMCRLEDTVSKITRAPLVAYTGDDEYSLHQFSLSPIFWLRRFWVRVWLNRMVPKYKLFYSQSDRQMKEFEKRFNVPTKFLVKCGDFSKEKIHQGVHDPIQIVYAGKLYCNRWKTLGMIADAIRSVNSKSGSVKLILNIYTADTITSKQEKLLNDGVHSIIHGRVPATQLPHIYQNSDIVLHVESFDLKNRLLTQDSFSTKVMDCLSSGCAVMAVCWEGHAAYQYLREKDAAIVASSDEEIHQKLEMIAADHSVINNYANKAYICGKENHQRARIQNVIYEDFERVING